MARDTITVQTVLGARPENIPPAWLIFNAPRPIAGDMSWSGDFVTGRLWCAVDPDGDQAAWCIQNNANMAAVLVQYVDSHTIDEWARLEMGSDYDPDDERWYQQMYLQSFGETTIPLCDVTP